MKYWNGSFVVGVVFSRTEGDSGGLHINIMILGENLNNILVGVSYLCFVDQ